MDSLDYQKTSIYNRLASLIVQDSIATIQNDILKIIGFELLEAMAKCLFLMRVDGTKLLFIESLEAKTFHIIKNYEYDANNKIVKTILYNGNKQKEVKINAEDSNLLVFGEIENINGGMLICNEKQKELLLCYDNIFTNMYKLNETISLWFLKTKDLMDKTRNPQEQRGLKSVVNNLLNRTPKSLTIIDKEDDLNLLQANISNTMINEAKEKIATVFGIPFSKIFKGTSSGFNNLDKNDIENWNFNIRFFQLQYIIPNIKKIYKLKGLESELENIKIEPIDYENKQIAIDLQTQKIENIIKLKSMNLINQQQATKLLAEII